MLGHQVQGKMTEENISNSSYLSAVMTTTGNDEDQTTVTMTTSLSRGVAFYFQCLVVAIGFVGAAANGVILYAMIVSKQHKKQFLIFNQNMLDLCSSLLLIYTFILRILNIRQTAVQTGVPGYLQCTLLFSGSLLWGATNGSIINLMSIAIERYLKVVHPTRSKKVLRKSVIYSAAAFAWIGGYAYNITVVFSTSEMVDGVCYLFLMWSSRAAAIAHGIWYFVSFYVIVLSIFIFCYRRILIVIRNQARVMATHSGPGPSTAQTNSNRIQANVIKTMIFVSAFYVITFTPTMVYYPVNTIKPGRAATDTGRSIVLLCAFLYITANPFIYAVKFDPVRRVLVKLVRLIPCKKSQPANESVDTAGTRADQKPN